MFPRFTIGAKVNVHILSIKNGSSVFSPSGDRSKIRQAHVAMLLLLLSCSCCYGQTSVVAVRTDAVIAISADSRQINFVNGVGTPVQVCKITLLGRKSTFASARLAEVPGVNFDAAELAVQAWREEKTIKARDRAFTEVVIPKLTFILQTMKDYAPKDFTQFNIAVLETIFVTIEHNVPKLVRTNYYPSIDKQGKVSVTTIKVYCPGDCPRRDLPYVIFLGEYAAIAEKTKAGLSVSYPAVTSQELVQLEIEKAGETVGPPISTLQITNSGRHWLAPGKCDGASQEQRNRQ